MLTASKPFAQVLLRRNLGNREVAVMLGTSETQVSRWRSGITPRPEMRERLIAELELTEKEIQELGWGEPARA